MHHKKCNINIILFWENIIKSLFGMIIPIVVGVLIVTFIDLYSIFNLIIFILLYTIVYCVSMWLFSMNDYERELIKKPMRKIFGRNK